jgi:hypothetical protein
MSLMNGDARSKARSWLGELYGVDCSCGQDGCRDGHNVATPQHHHGQGTRGAAERSWESALASRKPRENWTGKTTGSTAFVAGAGASTRNEHDGAANGELHGREDAASRRRKHGRAMEGKLERAGKKRRERESGAEKSTTGREEKSERRGEQ